MQEIEIEVPGGGAVFEIKGKVAVLSRTAGQPTALELPEWIEGPEENRIPVVGVGRKAVLGKKQLRRVYLPDSVQFIGEWAFAYCDALTEVRIPCAELGKDVFLGCARLRKLAIEGTARDAAKKAGDDSAYLLAAVAAGGDGGYLLDASLFGTAEWLAKWDARLIAFLDSPDSEGFDRQILCGEEDYGSTDREAYESGRRRRKAELLLLRLLHDAGLSDALKERAKEYLLAHAAGAPAGSESWNAVWQLHADEREWYELFSEIGGIRAGNMDRMLSDLGENHPELKAFLLGNTAGAGAEDFFGGLEL